MTIATYKTQTAKKIFHPSLFPVETYFIYTKLGRAEQKGNFSNFFTKLTNLDEHLMNDLVFLNKQSALQYGRFVQRNHVILKAYVPHVAIEGRIDGLCLKKGFVKASHIHGCFPVPGKSTVYVKNPYFNEQNKPKFLHHHAFSE